MELRSPRSARSSAAEHDIDQLTGVMGSRVVLDEGGHPAEIHVLASADVRVSDLIPSIASALFVHFGEPIDRRSISIARIEPTSEPAPAPERPAGWPGAESPDRLILESHAVERARSGRLSVEVVLRWRGRAFKGLAHGADVANSGMQTHARAVLNALEQVAKGTSAQVADPPELSLEGVSLVEAGDSQAILVSVEAADGTDLVKLTGAVVVEESLERAAVLGTLQAADRWVRGRLQT